MKSLLTTAFLVLFTASGGLMAQSDTYELLDKSTMQIEGTSTIHDWTADVQEFNTSITINSNALESEKVSSPVESFSLTVPVKKIESGKGGMNSKIYGALKEKKHPNITFTLSAAEISGTGNATVQLNVKGALTIAGTTRNISLPVESTLLEGGTYKFSGSYELNMKDYNVDPPSAVFGTIKSGEKVTISFELYFAKK